MARPQALKEKLQDRIDELRSLRDNIRLDLQLASMELRDEWRDIERKLPDAGVAAEHLKDLTTEALEALAAQLRGFRTRLRQPDPGSRVARIMTTDVATCAPSDTLARAVTVMWDRDVGCLPVLDEGGQVVGVITDRDAAIAACTRGLRMDDIRVDSVMSREVACCTPDDGADVALALMRSGLVRRLPVVGGDGRLAGLITLNDIARARAAEAATRPASVAEVLTTLTSIAGPPTPSSTN
jgi:CBS domain-containing protein